MSKQKVSNYLRDLTDKNVDLTHFVGGDPQELADLLDSDKGPEGVILCFYGYRWKLDGNAQRTFNDRTIHFSILVAGVDIEDYLAQDAAITQAEAIGLEVLSRIYQDSHRPAMGWLYQNIKKDAVIGEEIRPEKTEDLVGMDFIFEIRVQEPLVVDKAKWSDGSIFC